MTPLLILILIFALAYVLARSHGSSSRTSPSSHINALTGESYTPPTKESDRFSVFFMVKIETEKELEEFISICKAHDFMLHMAITSPTFWDTLLKGELYGKINYPIWFDIEHDAWGLRKGYVGYYRTLDKPASKTLYDKFGGSIDAFRKKLQPEETFAPQAQFLATTDKLWASASLQYGSFDKIPQERKNKIYNQMQEIANGLGYKEFNSAAYIENT